MLALLTVLWGCQEGLKCGEGTREDDGWCVAVPVDLPDVPETDLPPEDTFPALQDTAEPDEAVVGPEKPPFVGAVSFSEASAIVGFCAVHDTVYGNVEVRGTALQTLVDLDCLQRVNGALTITASSLTSIRLTKLQRVTGTVLISGPTLSTAIQLPALEHVGGNLVLGAGIPLSNLLVLDLPRLTSVGADLRLEDTRSLAVVELPSLVHVGRHLWLRRNEALTSAMIPRLEQIGGALRIETCPSIVELGLTALVDVGVTSTGELAIERNRALRNLNGITLLRTVSGPVAIRYNPSLSDALARALADGLTHVGGVIAIGDNGP